MSLNSAQLYFKSLIVNTPFTFATPAGTTLETFVAPPAINPDAMLRPQAFVWGSEYNSKRETMGMRGQLQNGSFRSTKYMMDIWVVWYQDLSQGNIDSEFPAVLDTIRTVIEQSPAVVENVVDNTTGRVSDFLGVGENNHGSYGPWEAISSQSTIVACKARFTFELDEWYLQ
jgi:hypothetical protein